MCSAVKARRASSDRVIYAVSGVDSTSSSLPQRFAEMLTPRVVAFAATLSTVVAAPPAFPSSGNGLWYKQPGRFDDWASDWLPVGNGFLAGTIYALVVCHYILSCSKLRCWERLPRKSHN